MAHNHIKYLAAPVGAAFFFAVNNFLPLVRLPEANECASRARPL